MRKITLDNFLLSNCIGVQILLLVHFISGDILFFHSDWESQYIYISVLGCLLGIVFFVLNFFCGCVFNTRSFSSKVILILNFFIFCVLQLAAWIILKNIYDPTWIYLGLSPIFLLLAIYALKNESIKRRFLLISRVFGGAVCVVTLATIFHRVFLYKLYEKESLNNRSSKHLVIMVLDGLPLAHLNTYNNKSPITGFDSTFSRGVKFNNFRTNFVWTTGFFNALYSEKVGTVFDKKAVAKQSVETLLSKLQEHEIKVFLHVGHPNALPQTSFPKQRTLKGLYSAFLTEKLEWIPNILKLQYGLFQISGKANSLLRNSIGLKLFNLMKTKKSSQNIYSDSLLPSLRHIIPTTDKSITLFHVAWALHTNPNPMAWDSSGLNQGITCKKIADSENHYDIHLESYAKVHREYVDKSIKEVGEKLKYFFEKIYADPIFSNTTFIVTADHGSMFSRGKFWYGFHPDEEVARVPFVVLNSTNTEPLKNNQNEFFSTVDLAQSISDFFGIGKNEANASHNSIFNSKSFRAPQTPCTITLPSNQRNEFFLSCYPSEKKITLNLHPNGNLETVIYKISNLEEEPLIKTNLLKLDLSNKNLFIRAIKEFCLPAELLHNSINLELSSTMGN